MHTWPISGTPMKKQKLNQHQLDRIRRKQGRHAALAGDTPAPADESRHPDQLGPEQAGLVISHFGQQLEIEALEGEHAGSVFRCHQRRHIDIPVPGDRVIWQAGDPYGVVVALSPRSGLLERPTPHGGLRPVAANTDLLLLVIAPVPAPIDSLIDRYLVAAHQAGLEVLILLNKLDTVTAAEQASLDELLSLYQGIGYRTQRVSARSGAGLPRLLDALQGYTSIVAGQSGVGKSALINALLPGTNTLEGDISTANARGRHTTTTARLFHLPGGGRLIDSPGIREFGLWHVSEDQLVAGFREIGSRVGHCRFRDCRHQHEPGCALREAVEAGEIHPRRLRSFLTLREELEKPDRSG